MGVMGVFGYVMANGDELSKEQLSRYTAVYCGICRHLRDAGGQTARLGLSYDVTFLAMVLMSLYEPEELSGGNACMLHPIKKRPWVQTQYTRYAGDMNLALAYYKAVDDYRDEGKFGAKTVSNIFSRDLERIRQEYPRQCAAMEEHLEKLTALEQENCSNPDLPAGCFGALMGELFVYRQDMWEEPLRQMGMALGRFIYLADAATDYRRDKKKHSYNPFLAMGMEEDWGAWEQYLVLAMGRCTDYFERLPLVQDKDILDNILYSGIWTQYRRRQGKQVQEETDDRRPL